MVATEQLPELAETEADRVERWRAAALERAGYPPEVALVIATDLTVDLHRACALLEQGCPLHTALEILT